MFAVGAVGAVGWSRAHGRKSRGAKLITDRWRRVFPPLSSPKKLKRGTLKLRTEPN
jgi:hypothetical protein